MKNIVHIITGLEDGGAESVLYRLCLNDGGNNVHYVISLTGDGKYGALLREKGVSVVCLNMRKSRVSLSGVVKLWKEIRELQPDVVQTWMYHADLVGGVVSRFAGVKSVFWGIRHSSLDSRHSSKSTIVVARICAWISFLVPKGIVCCARNAFEVHRDLGYCEDKMRVISNGYDFALFARDLEGRDELRQCWGDDGPIIGMVGRYNPQKDHKSLLAALGKVKEGGKAFRVVLVGKGLDSYNKDIRGWIEKFGLQDRVLLLGARNDIPRIMSALDLHVLSSSFGEGFPNVVAEAMACGTPVVSTDVGDAALIVGETGWIVPPQNPEAMAVAIETALKELSDLPRWRLRSEASCERVKKNFSLEKMVEEFNKAWFSNETKKAVFYRDDYP